MSGHRDILGAPRIWRDLTLWVQVSSVIAGSPWALVWEARGGPRGGRGPVQGGGGGEGEDGETEMGLELGVGSSLAGRLPDSLSHTYQGMCQPQSVTPKLHITGIKSGLCTYFWKTT